MNRKTCYDCYRPKTSCLCEKENKPLDLNSKFIILMHPKEFKKTKNGTGFITKNSIKDCEVFIGIDFTNHEKINKLINDNTYEPYVLYPSLDSISVNNTTLPKDKKNLIFIIDSTWPCSKKILRESKNLQKLKKISFTHNKTSNFRIKTQPQKECLSTIESTLCLLEELNKQNIENISQEKLSSFLNPFNKMVQYQLSYSNTTLSKPRFK